MRSNEATGSCDADPQCSLRPVWLEGIFAQMGHFVVFFGNFRFFHQVQIVSDADRGRQSSDKSAHLTPKFVPPLVSGFTDSTQAGGFEMY